MSGAALLVHGGGPTHVLNASLAGLVEEAARHPEMGPLWAARRGLAGLLEEDFLDLGRQPPELVRAIGHAPGSALGSSRRKVEAGDYECLLDICRRRDIRRFFLNGGNGSMFFAGQVARAAAAAGYEMQVIGIPKTIDNDVPGTDHTPGYGSAARFFACALRDVGMDNRALPTPVCVFETMGRDTGWLVAATALARAREDDSPHLIYFPERRLSEEQLCADIDAVYRRLGRVVVAICEGQMNERGEPFGADSSPADGFNRRLARNLGHMLSELVIRKMGLKARSEKPGILGRSSAELTSAVDRAEAWECGRAAVRAAAAGHSASMVTLEREPGAVYRVHTGLASLECAAAGPRLFPEAWIHPNGHDVQPEFLAYVAPLVGDVPPHPRFE